MKIIERKTDERGRLLVIYDTNKGNLIGEVYNSGKRIAGKWDSRATFYAEDGDADIYRVKKYFGF